MGLIGGLLTLPLAPAKGLGWVLEQVAQEAEAQYYDPRRIRAELAAAEAAFESGEIDEDEYEKIEDDLLSRLIGTDG
jgi:Gas vesicle protein G